MLPPDAIALAGVRWLQLLRTSTFEQASSLLRADPGYTDLTQTQYSSGLEWLIASGLLSGERQNLRLAPSLSSLGGEQLNLIFFQRLLQGAAPAWLPDADILVRNPTELPQDVLSLAATLGLSERTAFASVRRVHGRIDLEQRARIGAAGELALIELLEERWPGSTIHVAKTDDGFGYDILFELRSTQWHLEVKTTTRRGRLVIFVSRNEYEVSIVDPNWRLVVVGLDDHLSLQALATVRHSELFSRAPRDLTAESKWQSASHQLTAADLRRGLSFLDALASELGMATSHGDGLIAASPSSFAWMPEAD